MSPIAPLCWLIIILSSVLLIWAFIGYTFSPSQEKIMPTLFVGGIAGFCLEYATTKLCDTVSTCEPCEPED